MMASEVFPLITTNSDNFTALGECSSHRKPSSRRRSSGLGGEIRAGDTSVPALATLDIKPLSQSAIKVVTGLSIVFQLHRKNLTIQPGTT